MFLNSITFSCNRTTEFSFLKNLPPILFFIPNNKIRSISIFDNMLAAQEKQWIIQIWKKENNWKNKYFNDLPVCNHSVETE